MSGMGSEARAGRVGRRTLVRAALGCAVAGGALTLLPDGSGRPAGPAAGPEARARSVAAGGLPAALPDLVALISDLEPYLRDRPSDGRAWAVLGTAYGERGRRTGGLADYARAEDALRTSLRVRPRANPEAFGGLAELAVARRDFRAAKRWGEEAVRLAPDRWLSYPPLVDAYDGLGDHRAARRLLVRLSGLRSGPVVPALAARARGDRRAREDAAAVLADAAARAKDPAERAAHLLRAGELAWERGDRERALRCCAAALRDAPDTHAAQAGRARALAALGRVREATGAYRAALRSYPAPGYALELGELYEARGHREAAREQYRAVRTAVREEAAAGVNGALVLGRLEADHGDPEVAVRGLRAEWRRQPGLAVADALGWALHRAGRDEEALPYAGRATDRTRTGEVRGAPYLHHLGTIEAALGLDGPARRHLTEALRVNPYFSPLHAPAARTALARLGEPPEVGPAVDLPG
ncbi:hypothetical protein GCM10010145_24280 [Streptomyces ruber]|uniref:Tetratricopeptide repeat protein n=2 Tax=Streptomyces ruber TaxID=83378 RepID=A0A918BAR9_9ACTN|nr:hypothetical protein GCM10010145_24280 [Streptomyces ruber]